MDKDKKICQYCSNKKEQKCNITGGFVARKKECDIGQFKKKGQ
jgi:hypothetical protein